MDTQQFVQGSAVSCVFLTSHTILAIVIVPLILITLRRGLAERFDKHNVIASGLYRYDFTSA